MNNFKELVVWKKSIELTKMVYLLTANFPDKEKFGLTSQTQRSAVSIPSNIAEGAGRDSINEFNHFLSIAKASSYELETQLILARELGYTNEEDLKPLMELINEIQKMLTGLKKSLKEKQL
jgi:four helix bundle protein